MADDPRTQLIADRSSSARAAAEDLHAKLVDDGFKKLLQRRVLNQLDDVDGFFLGRTTRPFLEPTHEAMWLNATEGVLRSAEEQLRHLLDLVRSYGGPAKARTVGGD